MALVEHVQDDGVAVLTLNRPDSLNALSRELLDAILGTLDEVEASDAVGVVITGSGRAFCAGADLKEVVSDVDAKVRHLQSMTLRIATFVKPVVAAINGLAAGGGVEMASACTLRVAAPAATLTMPEIRLPAVPGAGGTQLLPRLVGPGRALELMLLGEKIDAERAREIGLVNIVTEDPVARAVGIARLIGRTGAVQLGIRKAVYDGLALPLREAMDIEHAIIIGFAGPDPEGIRSRFIGRDGKD